MSEYFSEKIEAKHLQEQEESRNRAFADAENAAKRSAEYERATAEAGALITDALSFLAANNVTPSSFVKVDSERTVVRHKSSWLAKLLGTESSFNYANKNSETEIARGWNISYKVTAPSEADLSYLHYTNYGLDTTGRMYVIGGGTRLDPFSDKFRVDGEVTDPSSKVTILRSQGTIDRLAQLTFRK